MLIIHLFTSLIIAICRRQTSSKDPQSRPRFIECHVAVSTQTALRGQILLGWHHRQLRLQISRPELRAERTRLCRWSAVQSLWRWNPFRMMGVAMAAILAVPRSSCGWGAVMTALPLVPSRRRSCGWRVVMTAIPTVPLRRKLGGGGYRLFSIPDGLWCPWRFSGWWVLEGLELFCVWGSGELGRGEVTRVLKESQKALVPRMILHVQRWSCLVWLEYLMGGVRWYQGGMRLGARLVGWFRGKMGTSPWAPSARVPLGPECQNWGGFELQQMQ